VNEDLGGIDSQMKPNAGNAMQLEKALPPKRRDVLGEKKMTVDDDTQVKDGIRRLNQDVRVETKFLEKWCYNCRLKLTWGNSGR